MIGRVSSNKVTFNQNYEDKNPKYKFQNPEQIPNYKPQIKLKLKI